MKETRDIYKENNIIIEVNSLKKKMEGFGAIALGLFILLIIITYLTFLRKLDFFQDTIITTFLRHISSHVTSFNLLGSFYIALFGGLFFIFMPMEAYFVNSLRYNHPALLFIVFLTGMLISYSLDYIIGMKLSKISRKVVSPKKFYKIKSYINKYGKMAIFLANLIPFLPSQQITFISGVFRYNKMRLFVFTISGQVIKMICVITFFRFIVS
jgi:membrane protein DedA with SNARE-associated domain